ncbi:MAG: hypothetical protein NTW19_05915 [Planctomycetota bacterium]|nr:hypothetical protein [Planctomycetota bacterium]
MSYPRKLHVLIVEDDSDAVEAYRVSFKTFKEKGFQLLDPCFARSFSDAKTQLDRGELFHVVILDMNLPIENRSAAVEGLVPGEQLLELIAKRDDHPVPVLLVVSGKLNLVQPLGNMQKRLDNDFWYGRLVNKGPEQDREIELGLTEALRYSDVGIHIADSGNEWFPTLSPREEDLLRRCVLTQGSCLGLDLRWWNAENGPSVSHPNPAAGPTKVLMGRFLFDDGLGASLPSFFKFEPANNGRLVFHDARILAQKLPHVKVYQANESRLRGLLVTQSVTNDGWPVPLNEYLRKAPKEVCPRMGSVINNIVKQLNLLGSPVEEEMPVGSVLWGYLNRDIIENVWKSFETKQLLESGIDNPLIVFDALKKSAVKHWANRLNCSHGDLNATNIAIDLTQPDNPQPYIFDAAGIRADLEFRDLATLEVTSILFNSGGSDHDILALVKPFYDKEFLPKPINAKLLSGATGVGQNICSVILAIRSQINVKQHSAYALLVFDAALRQLFGLAYQPNKIKTPIHACFLAAWTAKWLTLIAPRLFHSDKSA